MSEFTKGPWTASLSEVHEVRDTEGGRICILTQLRGRFGLGGRRLDSESPANARLIAAAPEIYENAKQLSAWIKHILPEWDSEVQKYMELLDAAIAKVEGVA